MKSLDWLRSRLAIDRAYWRATLIYASDVRASLLRDEPLDFAIAQAKTCRRDYLAALGVGINKDCNFLGTPLA